MTALHVRTKSARAVVAQQHHAEVDELSPVQGRRDILSDNLVRGRLSHNARNEGLGEGDGLGGSGRRRRMARPRISMAEPDLPESSAKRRTMSILSSLRYVIICPVPPEKEFHQGEHELGQMAASGDHVRHSEDVLGQLTSSMPESFSPSQSSGDEKCCLNERIISRCHCVNRTGADCRDADVRGRHHSHLWYIADAELLNAHCAVIYRVALK